MTRSLSPAIKADDQDADPVPGSFSQIRPGLFLGGLSSLLFAEQLGVTHFVTILPSLSVLQDSPDFQYALQAKFKRLHICLEDIDHANLLPHLEGAVAFIASALNADAKVLVHCAAGISRSATVVIAYLMVVERLSVNQAFASVQKKAPWTQPNPGFWHQLKLFEAMGYRLDPEFEPYKVMVQMQNRQLATINTRPMPKLSKGEAADLQR